MPVDDPGWFDGLPENVTEAEYRGLPEEISGAMEIVHGHIIKCEPPTPGHNRIARRLANALEAARSPAGPRLKVETDTAPGPRRPPSPGRFMFEHDHEDI